MTGIRAVFFDVDDTLVDFDTAARAALSDVLGPEADYDEWVGLTHYERFNRGELDFVTMRETRMADYLVLLGRGAEVDQAAELEARRFDALFDRYALFDDVLPCLSVLRADGLRLGLITNNEPSYQHTKIRRMGLDELVDTIVISGEIGIAKPDPRIFAYACAALDVDASAAMHVGDSLDADVIGALGAGLRGVWLDRRGRRGSLTGETPAGASVVTGLGEVPGLLA